MPPGKTGDTIVCVNGGIAQLGERLLRKQEVTGSNPAISIGRLGRAAFFDVLIRDGSCGHMFVRDGSCGHILHFRDGSCAHILHVRDGSCGHILFVNLRPLLTYFCLRESGDSLFFHSGLRYNQY